MLKDVVASSGGAKENHPHVISNFRILAVEQTSAECPLLADFCRSKSSNVLVKSNANDWSSRMQMGGQVRAIRQKELLARHAHQ